MTCIMTSSLSLLICLIFTIILTPLRFSLRHPHSLYPFTTIDHLSFSNAPYLYCRSPFNLFHSSAQSRVTYVRTFLLGYSSRFEFSTLYNRGTFYVGISNLSATRRMQIAHEARLIKPARGPQLAIFFSTLRVASRSS